MYVCNQAKDRTSKLPLNANQSCMFVPDAPYSMTGTHAEDAANTVYSSGSCCMTTNLCPTFHAGCLFQTCGTSSRGIHAT